MLERCGEEGWRPARRGGERHGGAHHGSARRDAAVEREVRAEVFVILVKHEMGATVRIIVLSRSACNEAHRRKDPDERTPYP
jgi:hypothetical protein